MSDIHHEVSLPASPDRVYAAIADSDQHAAFTGAPAEIPNTVGAAFTTHGGQIQGRIIDLEPGKRIVQAWRVAAWPPGLWSLVTYRFEAKGDGTKLILDHAGCPADGVAMLEDGWNQRYWGPLKTYLS